MFRQHRTLFKCILLVVLAIGIRTDEAVSQPLPKPPCKVTSFERIAKLVWPSLYEKGLPEQPILSWLNRILPSSGLSGDVVVGLCDGSSEELLLNLDSDREVCADFEVVTDAERRETLNIKMFVGNERDCATNAPKIRQMQLVSRTKDWRVDRVIRSFRSLGEIADYYQGPEPEQHHN